MHDVQGVAADVRQIVFIQKLPKVMYYTERTSQGQEFNLCTKLISPLKHTTPSSLKNLKVLNSCVFTLNFATFVCKSD
jgi:hypothetical protein